MLNFCLQENIGTLSNDIETIICSNCTFWEEIEHVEESRNRDVQCQQKTLGSFCGFDRFVAFLLQLGAKHFRTTQHTHILLNIKI